MEDALKYIVNTYGVDILRNGQKLIAYFANIAPELRREQKLLRDFIQCDGNTRLLDAMSRSDAARQLEWNLLTQYMEREMWISSYAVSLVCNGFWNAASGGKIPAPVKMQVQAPPQKADTIEIAGRKIRTDITELNLSFCKYLTDLDRISGLSQLKTLHLSGCFNLTDISSLSGLSQLTSLHLSECSILTDIRPLSGLSQLTSLDLIRCYKLADISPLSGLFQLNSLNLSFCVSPTDLNPLSGLSQLTSLNLSWRSKLTDIRPLSGLSQLTSLDLSQCYKLTDISPLFGLSQLKTLNLNECRKLAGEDVEKLKAALPYCDI